MCLLRAKIVATIPLVAGVKDEQSVTEDWTPLRDGIAGVKLHEIPNLVTQNGVMTEIFRADWGVAEGTIEQTIYVALRGDTISAWHMHLLKTDHLMVVSGALRVVLYDGREDSATQTRLEVLYCSPMHPTLLVIPPGVWHGLQNLEATPSAFVNFFDRAYDPKDPDDWRLPLDTEEIPYRF